MRHVGRIQCSSDTPLHELYRQGIAWEQLRASYWARRGNAELVMDATARAQHYAAKYEALPETSHLYSAPQAFR